MVQDNQAKQTVFVVGAGSGIGRGIAEAFEVQGFVDCQQKVDS